MKSIVIYFSAETGKTRAIAEELSVKLGAASLRSYRNSRTPSQT